MKKYYAVRLSSEERNRLEVLVNTECVPAYSRKQAQILLLVDQGERGPSYIDWTAADYLGVSLQTVRNARQRCVVGGLDTALAHPKRIRELAHVLDGDPQAQLVAIARGETPKRPARWTLHLLCDGLKKSHVVLSVSHEPVPQVLKNTINPPCQEIWDIPPNHDAAFACAMEQVLEVYKRPYDPKHPTVCMHETTKQCVREIRATQPVRCVPSVRCDAEYERNGVAHLLLFYMPLGNWRRVVVQRNCATSAWAEAVRQLVEEDFPEAQRITLVTDNLETHHGASLYEAFPPGTACRLTDKLEFVYTPKHGSWLNMAECESSVLSSQCLKRRTRDVNTVKEEVVTWANHCNNHSEPAQWRFTKGDARTKLPRLYSRISDGSSTRRISKWL